MNEIYLIRHAESEANIEHIFGTDAPLTLAGNLDAKGARKLYELLAFDKIYSSKLLRAETTAIRLFGKLLPESSKLEEFNEIWFGKAEGLKSTRTGIKGYKYQYKDNFVEFMKECEGDNPYKRAKIAINKLQELSDEMNGSPQEYPQKRICIVTSDTLMRCIIQTLIHQDNWNNINDVKHIDNLDALKLTYDDKLLAIESFEKGNITETLYEKTGG